MNLTNSNQEQPNNKKTKLNFSKLKGSKKILLGLGLLATTSTAYFLGQNEGLTPLLSEEIADKPTLGALNLTTPTVKYGFALDTFEVLEEKIKPNDIFTKMLMNHGRVSYRVADSLEKVAKPFYNFALIQDGKPYTVLAQGGQPAYFIYEPDAKRYIVFDLRGNTPSVKEVKRPVEVREFESSGKIVDNLWTTLVGNGLSYALTDMVEDALKYQVDLRHFQDGDAYKLIWEEEIVDGRAVNVKTLKAAYFKQHDEEKPIYAIFYDNGKDKGWYSKDGLSMKAGFLKAPLKFSHITSGYNLRRLHPVLGYVKPHFGTDYAAPHGTPILAVADGVVTEAAFTRGNGNYVKIKHMKPYETQYLHMSRFAVRKGTRVKQGQVIGYVGSTGLATGPHVCFRFWKNGVQVDHRREKLPSVSTFNSSDKKAFADLSQSMIKRLEQMPEMSEAQLKAQKRLFDALRGKP